MSGEPHIERIEDFKRQHELEHEMRQLAAEMSLIGEAPGVQLRPIVHGGSRNYSPTGSNRTMQSVWLKYFYAAPDIRERETVVIKARVALAKARKAHRPARLTGKELDQYLLEVYEGESAEYAAIVEGYSARHIERLRVKANRRPSDGRLVRPQAPT